MLLVKDAILKTNYKSINLHRVNDVHVQIYNTYITIISAGEARDLSDKYYLACGLYLTST